jgi:hypothetical protein
MSAPSYNDFIAGVQQADMRALALLTNGNVIQTTENTEADAIYAQLQRLFQYEMINLPKRGYNRLTDGTIWQTFEARVTPTALNYMAQAAMERIILSRAPIPA